MRKAQDVARERVCREMDWWRAWMFERIKETRYPTRTELEPEELIVCAILTAASLSEYEP